MSPFQKLALAGTLCVAAWPLFAADGVLIVQKTTVGTSTRTTQVQIEKNRMRMELAGANGEKQVTVFDAVKQELTTINFDRRTYYVMTKADADRLGTQAADMRGRMQAQIAAMPPAQRAQMESLMRGRGGAAETAVPKPQYRKTGTDKVGRWTCDKYEGILNNEKVADLCTVDPPALGLTPADFAVANQMSAFFKTMAPQVQEQLFAPGTVEAQGYTGVPIRQIIYRNGQPQYSSELQQITRQSFPASIYDIPAGFQKQEAAVGAIGRGRGRGTP